MSEHPNVVRVRRLLAGLEAGRREALTEFYAPGVRQVEHPNRLVAKGATRDLQGLLQGFDRGRKVVTSERYLVKSAVAEGDRVALEVEWSATLAVAVGSLPAGGTMRAHLAMFFDFDADGRAVGQRSYDCFEPF